MLKRENPFEGRRSIMKRLSVMICAILVVAGLSAMSADKELKSLQEAKER